MTAGASSDPGADAFAAFCRAVRAFGDDDTAGAAAHARRAAECAPDDLLFAAARDYLARVARDGKRGPGGVYTASEGFSAFIRGGGNRRLYGALAAALSAIYCENRREPRGERERDGSGARLLDIGAGDGLALVPAVTAARGRIGSVTVLEPSPMLPTATAALDALGVPNEPIAATLQAFAAGAPGAPDAAGASDRRWDLAQATFSLHNIPPRERAPLWAWLRGATDRLVIAEFDVPAALGYDEDAEAGPSERERRVRVTPERVRQVVDRYRVGLGEYAAESGARALVADGFLMPVMFGNFDRGVARSTYEQPIRAWADELAAAGFAHVEVRALDDYWWSPACLVDAR